MFQNISFKFQEHLVDCSGHLAGSRRAARGARIFENGLLTHWGRVTHHASVDWVIIISDNGLSPVPHQAIIGAKYCQ